MFQSGDQAIGLQSYTLPWSFLTAHLTRYCKSYFTCPMEAVSVPHTSKSMKGIGVEYDGDGWVANPN